MNRNLILIVSNPPYVAHDIATEKSLTHEPDIALYAKNKGMSDIEHIIGNAKFFLEQGGYLYIEHAKTKKIKFKSSWRKMDLEK